MVSNIVDPFFTGVILPGGAVWADSPDHFFFGPAPGATAPATSTTASTAPSLPESSLAGQTWGRIIPITAGARDIPGRPIWKQVRKEGDFFFLDAAVSYGWRAEIMGGFDPVDISLGAHLANGVEIWDAGLTEAPGLTVTEYDGTQLEPDPFMESVLGAGNVPAYIYHIYAVYQNLPLEKFGNKVPDAWNLRVADAVEFTFEGIRPLWSDPSLNNATLNTPTDDQITVTAAVGNLVNGRSVDGIGSNKRAVIKVRIDAIPSGFGKEHVVGVTTSTNPATGAEQGPSPSAWYVLKDTVGSSGGSIGTSPTTSSTSGKPEPGVGDFVLIAVDTATTLGQARITFGVNGTYFSDPILSPGRTITASGTWRLFTQCDVTGFQVSIVEPLASDLPSGFVGVPTILNGITLARCYELMAALSRELVGRVDVAANIADTVDSLFIVEQGTFNSFGLSIARLCNCDLRENNDGVEVVRAVDGTDYSVDLALVEDVLLRKEGESGLTFTRTGEQNLPQELIAQFIASEASFRFTDRPARREVGPKKTTTSTKKDTIRVPLGMPINQAQTYVSQALYREVEARDQVTYKLPWEYAIKVQAAEVHTVPDGPDLLTVKVTRADRQPNRTVAITAQKLHTAMDYNGVADAGVIPDPSPSTDTLDATTLLPGAGSIIVSGPAPTVANGRTLAPGVGGIVVAGPAPTVSSELPLAPAAGAIVVSGPAPTISTVSTTTLNPSDKGANITLSNGDLTAEKTVAGSWTTVRSVGTMTGTDKVHFEFTIDTLVNNDGFIIGLCKTAVNILSSYPGSTLGSCGWQTSGLPYNMGAGAGPNALTTVGDRYAVEVDMTAKKIWIARNNDGWNNNNATNDPATGLGGLNFPAEIATSDVVHFALGIFRAQKATMNFGASTFQRAVSSGFTSFD